MKTAHLAAVVTVVVAACSGCGGEGREVRPEASARRKLHERDATAERRAEPAPEKAAPAPAAPPEQAGSTPRATTDGAKLIAERPYGLGVPMGLDESTPAPLFIYLHGYGATSEGMSRILHVPAFARAKGFVYVTPDGTTAPSGRRFWNATPACCNFAGSTVDDVAYIAAIIADVQAHARIDARRIYVVGFSNGGFMAHRLACELSDRIAGIVSIAGATFEREARCRPASPVAVLQIHGDADDIVPYRGGHALGRPDIPRHPAAQTTVARWAAHNGCAPTATAVAEPLDIEPRISGSETRVIRHENCRDGGAAELWTVRGGSHFVAQSPAAAEAIYEFLMAHHKPDPPRAR